MAKETAVAAKKDEKNDLEKALDGALADLQKAAGSADLEKSEKKDDEKEESKAAPFEKKDEKKDDEKEDAKGDEEESDEDKKAQKEGYRKSVETDLTKSAPVKNAVEVSKFLGEIVKSLGEFCGDLKNSNSLLVKRVAALEKSNAAMADALVKSFSTSNEITKSLAGELAVLGGRPMARKSIPAGVKIETLTKSARGDEEAAKGGDLTKSQIATKLADLEMTNKVPLGTTSRYEAAGLMNKSVEALVFGEQA